MLTHRSLTLSRLQVLPDGLVLRREILSDSVLAEQLLANAQAQADALLESARVEADRLREDAQKGAVAEVWRQADALLENWQLQRRQMWENITATAEALVGTALQQLLAEQTDGARISALVQQLLAAQPEDDAAVLYCHPDWFEPAAERLQQASAAWTLRADPLLPPQTLCLRTEQGEFSLSWTALTDAFWPGATADRAID
ncbi:type III secretion system stator protein SctL [Pseudomonas sp. NPDC086278]|uniref:type III secretion system stator protein SctL n=1 Tax=Pseudomonas sp. NPDC086278 TaxID=3390646 RepID=UPI003CFCB4B8